MSGRSVRFVWCGLLCWRFGIWRAPRGASVYELGPLEVIIKPTGYAQ
jgi:hypothetical protein